MYTNVSPGGHIRKIKIISLGAWKWVEIAKNVKNFHFRIDFCNYLNQSISIWSMQIFSKFRLFISFFDFFIDSQPLPFFRLAILLDIYRAYKMSTFSDVRHDQAYFKNRKNWSGFVIWRTFDPNFSVKYSAKFLETGIK